MGTAEPGLGTGVLVAVADAVGQVPGRGVELHRTVRVLAGQGGLAEPGEGAGLGVRVADVPVDREGLLQVVFDPDAAGVRAGGESAGGA